jgi:hypothetical protein
VQAPDLIVAVLGEAAAAGVPISKTKLLKLLYLIDIETYRASGRIATEWRWKFHHFGPWAAQYDAVLESLNSAGKLSITVLPGDRDTQLIRGNQRDQDVSSVTESDIRAAMRRVLNRWLPRDLPEILDHVYFDTEPMHSVERGVELDFSKVTREVQPVYRRERGSAGPRKIAELRMRLGLTRDRDTIVHQHGPQQPTQPFTQPNYDTAALELLNTLEDD